MNGAKVEYSKSLDRPFFSLSLHDAAGKRLEAVQDTPPGHFDRRTFIITAGHDLQFSTPMQQIPPGEAPSVSALSHHTSHLTRAACIQIDVPSRFMLGIGCAQSHCISHPLGSHSIFTPETDLTSMEVGGCAASIWTSLHRVCCVHRGEALQARMGSEGCAKAGSEKALVG